MSDKSLPDNLVILLGRVTMPPILSPGAFGGSIDFELKSGSGYHQVVSVEPDIVKKRDSLKGLIRVFGRLSSKDGDSVIMAQRVEYR